MPGRFGHYQHVVRVAALFAVGFGVFLVIRALLVPADFGRLGFYRAGALDDVRAQAVVFAGQGACAECHTDVMAVRKAGSHAKVSCESCHGPLASHASDYTVKPRTLDPRSLCLGCHTANAGKPRDFPQIIPADHGGDGPCRDCHTPHNPRIQ
jgi:predicted CXXCH cytochrome family protein